MEGERGKQGKIGGKLQEEISTLSAGRTGRGGIPWGACPAVALLTCPVLFSSSSWAGCTATRQRGWGGQSTCPQLKAMSL